MAPGGGIGGATIPTPHGRILLRQRPGGRQLLHEAHANCDVDNHTHEALRLIADEQPVWCSQGDDWGHSRHKKSRADKAEDRP